MFFLGGQVLSRQHTTAVARDLPIFLGADDEHAHGGPSRRDIALGALSIQSGVDVYAKEFERAARSLTDQRNVLADTAGEYQGVEAAQRAEHRAYAGREAVNENFQRQARAFVAAVRGADDFAHVARSRQ